MTMASTHCDLTKFLPYAGLVGDECAQHDFVEFRQKNRPPGIRKSLNPKFYR